MSRTPWHIHRDGPRLTVSRHVPAVLDICAETQLPDAGRLAVAQQIRQDMWRALRDVRGFSPVVEVTRQDSGLHIRAGGRVAGRAPHVLNARVQDVLDNAKNRQRWVRHAGGAA